MILADLDSSIASFASLVGLILALVTLFTGSRDASVRILEDDVLSKDSKPHLRREAKLALALMVVTLLLLASGFPLWVRTCAHFTTSTNHAIRWAFIIVWPLLLPLAAWQRSIAGRAKTKTTETWRVVLGLTRD